MVPFADLLAALDRIPDPRRRQGRRYGVSRSRNRPEWRAGSLARTVSRRRLEWVYPKETLGISLVPPRMRWHPKSIRPGESGSTGSRR